MKKLSLIFFFIANTFILFAQSDLAEYREAKRLFAERQYASARGGLAPLTRGTGELALYAGFYYGLSAYHMGDSKAAADMWLQTLQKAENWDQKQELLFWLAYAHLEAGNYDRGLEYAARYTRETGSPKEESAMLEKFISQLPADSIRTIYDSHPQNKPLALAMIKAQNRLPYSERDLAFIEELVEKWGFSSNVIKNAPLPVIMKEEYNIGVLLPFLFESPATPGSVLQNSLVTDLYQGMLLAEEFLDSLKKPVNLFPFDTRKKAEVTRKIFANPTFSQLDLMIGPLYPDPVEVAREYSEKNKLNMVNPLSSNSSVIGSNPYTFLMKPATETVAAAISRLAQREVENKNVMIFYEAGQRDSLMAATYRQLIEAAGYRVVWYKEINETSAKGILDTLTAQYEIFYTREQADSVNLLSGRYIRTRRVRDDELSHYQRFLRSGGKETDYYPPISLDDNNKEIFYYEERFYIAPDSIGHILGATRSNLFANNLISAIETRGDHTSLYTYSDWLDFTMVSFNQLERLKVAMTSPDFADKNKLAYQWLEKKIKQKYRTLPSVYHLTGFELVWYLGNKMHSYGKYFQRGIEDYYYGKVFEGFRYGLANDNQVVPIIRFQDKMLKVVNRDDYEGR